MMKLRTRPTTVPGAGRSMGLSCRMVSPLCGIAQRIGSITRERGDPCVHVVGVELCGVHHWAGQPSPGSYHIGGMARGLEEAVMKALAETAERYAHFAYPHTYAYRWPFSSYRQMAATAEGMLPVSVPI